LSALVDAECPEDVVDRLLWRNAQSMLARHSAERDGSCHWCGRPWPCAPHHLAQRADAASRLPWQEAWSIRNDLTRLLPALRDDRLALPPRARRNHGSFD
jgi:hypothetical protein